MKTVGKNPWTTCAEKAFTVVCSIDTQNKISSSDDDIDHVLEDPMRGISSTTKIQDSGRMNKGEGLNYTLLRNSPFSFLHQPDSPPTFPLFRVEMSRSERDDCVTE
jgi:hypothetical protein